MNYKTLLFDWLLRVLHLPTHRSPVLRSLRRTPNLRVGMDAEISGHAAHISRMRVTVTQPGAVCFEGDLTARFKIHFIPVDAGLVTVEIVLWPDLASADLFQPVTNRFVLFASPVGPRLRIWGPWFARAGRLVCIGWTSIDATDVASELDDGGPMRRQSGPPESALLHRFEKPGWAILRFIAKGPHGLTPMARIVWVWDWNWNWKPKPRIRVEKSIQCGRPGQNVSFSWKILNAEPAGCHLECLFQNRRHDVQPVGSFVVTITTIPEEFILCARGPGGVRRVRLRAVPWFAFDNQ